MAESTRDMRSSVYERELKPRYAALKMWEITKEDLRSLCDTIVERRPGDGLPRPRDRTDGISLRQRARQQGSEPCRTGQAAHDRGVPAAERALSSADIGAVYEYLEHVATSPVIRLAVKLLLLTMLRKSELIMGEWSEINFTDAVWTIPAKCMKRRNPHNVYLSRQALDILVALKTCAGGSRYILPSRYDPDRHLSQATFNQVTALVISAANAAGCPLEPFTPHDFRRTASTFLHEAGYNTDWIEKSVAHEQKGVRAVYNKAEYADQRRQMLQDWADMIDRWTVTRPPPAAGSA